MATPFFDQVHSKITETSFCFPEFAPACKKSVHSIYSFLRYSQCYSPVIRLATPILDHSLPQKNLSTFNLSEFVSTCKNSGGYTDLFWKYGWLKNPASDWLRTFWPISQEQKIFPNMRFVQEHSK